MELQAEAERRKRAQILESEGARQSKINVEEGNKAGIILASEAAREDSINRAVGAGPPVLNKKSSGADCAVQRQVAAAALFHPAHHSTYFPAVIQSLRMSLKLAWNRALYSIMFCFMWH